MLKFYDTEFEEFNDEWETKLSPRRARFLLLKLRIRYKVDYFIIKFSKRTSGYFETVNRVMKLPKDCNVGIVVHEFAHALEHQKYGNTFHKKRMLKIIRRIHKHIKLKGYVEVHKNEGNQTGRNERSTEGTTREISAEV